MIAVAAAACALLSSAQESARPEAPVCALQRLPEGAAPPVIDGVVGDAEWSASSALGALTQVEPIEGASPSQPTEVRLCYDSNSLYIALLCFDSEPSKIRDSQMQRDAELDPDDRVEILIDSFLDRRNAFWFQIGAAGSKGDALVSRNGSGFNKQWDGIWYGRARVTERGWEAEIAIPFATLNFDPRGHQWGFNLRRFIRRNSEEVRWASPRLNAGFFSVSEAGTLDGLHDLHQGLGLDFKPFAVVDSKNDHTGGDSDTLGDAGFDLFYRLTANIKLALSVHTDFAETEVDARQVNLTRFPLFFPEKRDFFLEDSGVFQFGGASSFSEGGDVIPFFSRRIGLSASGEEVPIAVATKVTGRTDSYGFGLLDVQTESAHGVDSTNLFAGRFTKNIFEQSDAGVIVTHGDPTDADARADTFGVDLNLRTSEFLGDRNLRFGTYAVQTSNEGADGRDLAYSANIAYPNDVWDWALATTTIEQNFDPALGFVPRTDIRKHEAHLTYAPRLNTWIRSLQFQVEPVWITGTDGATQTMRVEVQPLGVETESGENLHLETSATREVLDTPFDIHPGVTIPPGDYRFDRLGFEFTTSDKRPVDGYVSWTTGEFYDGTSDLYFAGLHLRTSKYFLFGTELEHDDVRLPGGDFTVDLARVRITVLTSPDFSWTNFAQWETDSDTISLNSRLWWILEPGTEFFLVLNQGWEHDSPHTAPTTTEVAFKFGYTFRF